MRFCIFTLCSLLRYSTKLTAKLYKLSHSASKLNEQKGRNCSKKPQVGEVITEVTNYGTYEAPAQGSIIETVIAAIALNLNKKGLEGGGRLKGLTITRTMTREAIIADGKMYVANSEYSPSQPKSEEIC